MHIKLVNLKAEYLSIKDEIDEAVQAVMAKSAFILGEEVAKFEETFARYIGRKHCVGVACGTDALQLAVRVMDTDTVYVPTTTIAADIEAVLHEGKRALLYDRTPPLPLDNEAFIIVHLYGIPNVYCRGREVIEDCAQATGSEYVGEKCGTFGQISCFSFYPSKVLGCYGDGGAILTDDDVVAEELQSLRRHGCAAEDKYFNMRVGYNSRLDGIQAAILNVKMKYLDRWIMNRRCTAAQYSKELENIEEIILPQIPLESNPSWYMYAINADKRDELRAYLKEKGIQAEIHYPRPLHMQPAYSQPGLKFPMAEEHARKTLSLPMNPFLSEGEVSYVCQMIKEFYETGR